MAYILNLRKILEPKGSLVVIEKVLPFDIKRIYYIYDVPKGITRGGHKHRKNIQALVCVRGSCEVLVSANLTRTAYLLDSPDKCLILQPQDWHTMTNFTDNATLMVMASEYYDVNDYVLEEPTND
ncbi:MAG: FdtA/QdtA family cupin domain-containing protein [Gammaproteobacteria bacterium]|nr:FdtA/QdtA family cupin domain-containing protein [Gammaproteobacteria bacterium]